MSTEDKKISSPETSHLNQVPTENLFSGTMELKTEVTVACGTSIHNYNLVDTVCRTLDFSGNMQDKISEDIVQDVKKKDADCEEDSMDCNDIKFLKTNEEIQDHKTSDEDSSSSCKFKCNKSKVRSRIESFTTTAHKDQPCSNVCKICKIPFGILDNPFHPIDCQSEEMKTYIQTSTSWDLEDCLCGLCFKNIRLMYKSITGGDSLKKKPYSKMNEKMCCVSNCSGETHEKLVASDILKKEIHQKYVLIEHNKSSKYFWFCIDHSSEIYNEFARECTICKTRSLTGISKIQKFKNPGMVEAFNSVLMEKGKVVQLDKDSEVCRDCKGRYSNYIYKRNRNPAFNQESVDNRKNESKDLIIKTRKQQTLKKVDEFSPEKVHYSPFHEGIPCSDHCAVCIIKFATYDIPFHGENFKTIEVQTYFVETTHLPLNACICPKCFRDIKYNYTRSLENVENENSKPCTIEKCEEQPSKVCHFKSKNAYKIQELSGLAFCKILDSGNRNSAKKYDLCLTHWQTVRSVLEPPNQCVTCKVNLEHNALFAPFRKNVLTVNTNFIERVNKCLNMDGHEEEINDESQLCHHCHSYWLKKAETCFNKDGHYIKQKAQKGRPSKQCDENQERTPRKSEPHPVSVSESVKNISLEASVKDVAVIEESKKPHNKKKKVDVLMSSDTEVNDRSSEFGCEVNACDSVTVTLKMQKVVHEKYLAVLKEFTCQSDLLSTLLDVYNEYKSQERNFGEPSSKKLKVESSPKLSFGKHRKPNPNIHRPMIKCKSHNVVNQLSSSPAFPPGKLILKGMCDIKGSSESLPKKAKKVILLETSHKNSVVSSFNQNNPCQTLNVTLKPKTPTNHMKDITFNSADQLKSICKKLESRKQISVKMTQSVKMGPTKRVLVGLPKKNSQFSPTVSSTSALSTVAHGLSCNGSSEKKNTVHINF